MRDAVIRGRSSAEAPQLRGGGDPNLHSATCTARPTLLDPTTLTALGAVESMRCHRPSPPALPGGACRPGFCEAPPLDRVRQGPQPTFARGFHLPTQSSSTRSNAPIRVADRESLARGTRAHARGSSPNPLSGRTAGQVGAQVGAQVAGQVAEGLAEPVAGQTENA